jgi:hypothetical protein
MRSAVYISGNDQSRIWMGNSMMKLTRYNRIRGLSRPDNEDSLDTRHIQIVGARGGGTFASNATNSQKIVRGNVSGLEPIQGAEKHKNKSRCIPPISMQPTHHRLSMAYDIPGAACARSDSLRVYSMVSPNAFIGLDIVINWR